MISSLPFLLITFCVYGYIPELRNLHGKSLMCYVFSLSSLYISLSTIQLNGNTFEMERFPCIFSGYMIYLSVLLCFFWLNVMCYDICLAFRVGINRRRSDLNRFLVYCLYALGVPLLLTAIVFIIDLTTFIPEAYRPLMGVERCYLQKIRVVEVIYTYIPLTLIVSVNITLYAITAYKINKVLKETSLMINGDSQRHWKVDANKDM